MTQYRTELYNALKRLQEEPDTTINIFLTDLNRESDSEILKSNLLSLQGVKQVKTSLSQKRLTVTYNPEKATPQSIAYNINKLGYHHIGRG